MSGSEIVLNPDANPSFEDYLDAAISEITEDYGSAWFQLEGNTYFVIGYDNSSSPYQFVDGEDIVIEVSGLVGLDSGGFLFQS